MKRFFLSCAVSLFFAQTALAISAGGVGGRPAYPDPEKEHSSQWFLYTLKPGESKEDALIVQNNTDEPTDVRLYAADSTPSTDGGFALEQMVEPKDFVGAWVTLLEKEFHLGANESRAVPFTIRIPNDPKLDVGEHTGGILIEKIQKEAKAEGGIQLLTRVGVRIYVTIPGEIVKRLEIEKFDVGFQTDQKLGTASMTIKNSGNVSQNIVVKTKISLAWSWLKIFFKNFPIENERHLQVLRESSLVSNFEFAKPLFGKLIVEGSMLYEDGTQGLTAPSVKAIVPLDRNMILLLLFGGLFLLSIILYGIFSRKRR